MKKKKKKLIVLFFLLIAMAITIHFSVNRYARKKFWVDVYPVTSKLSQFNLTCSGKDSNWLTSIIKVMSENMAPASQAVHISPTGDVSMCQSGYRGTPLLSAKNTENTRFRYASVTKLFTSDAILKLIRDKQLHFDTRLADILKLPQPKDSRVYQITIEDLLLHRGGFDRLQAGSEDMFYYDREPLCPNELEKLSTITLNFTPGEKVAYSNLGYCLLGEVIRVVSGQPYKVFMEEQYKLKDYGILFNKQVPYADEVGYNHVDLSLTSKGGDDFYDAYDYDGLAAVAGLSGSALSLSKQVAAMLKRQHPNILSQNEEYQCDLSKLRDCYGYAMFPYREKDGESTMYFRDGNLEGLSTLVAVDDKHSITVLLSNGIPVNGEKDLDKVKMLIYSQVKNKY